MEWQQKMVYAVTIKFKQDNQIYKLEVDCKTGEVKESNTNQPPHNPNGGNGWDD